MKIHSSLMCLHVLPFGIFTFLLDFFFNATATTEIYTLSLHDALPICRRPGCPPPGVPAWPQSKAPPGRRRRRSEEHTSELQSRLHLVCRLLLEKKNSPPIAAIA